MVGISNIINNKSENGGPHMKETQETITKNK